MVGVFYSTLSKSSAEWSVDRSNSAAQIYENVAQIEGICMNSFYLVDKSTGRVLARDTTVDTDLWLHAHLRVLGGKGGFGSMLRAIGARIEKTTNHEACRDLSGRRMRDVNNEKQVGEWLKKRDDAEEEREKRHEEKIQRLLNPVHHYEDKDYTKNIQENATNIDQALKTGLKKEKGSREKRKPSEKPNQPTAKKSRMWMGISDDEASESEDEENDTPSIEIDTPSIKIDTQSIQNETSSMQNDTPAIQNDSAIENDTKPTESKSPCLNDTSTIEKVSTVDDTTSNKINNLKKNDTHGSKTDEESIELVDISNYNSAEHLQEVGLSRLKATLQSLGLKCGGSLHERTERLFLLKNTPIEKLDQSHFARKKKNQ